LIDATTQVHLRPFYEEDLCDLWEMSAKEENPEWKKWDAPYYPYSPKTFQFYPIKTLFK
jgi:hypothetical protein